jgi:hypothetical protein
MEGGTVAMTDMDRDSVLQAQVSHTLTEIAELEKALDGAELVVTGSTGQPRAHPVLAELRAHRVLLLRMLGVFTAEGAGPVEDELDRIRAEWENSGGP